MSEETPKWTGFPIRVEGTCSSSPEGTGGAKELQQTYHFWVTWNSFEEMVPQALEHMVRKMQAKARKGELPVDRKPEVDYRGRFLLTPDELADRMVAAAEENPEVARAAYERLKKLMGDE